LEPAPHGVTVTVAALTAFLLSDAAAAITGQQLLVCGGASLWTGLG
jgi:enoyl-[acyl-carrier-protein] reductase (NADH)